MKWSRGGNRAVLDSLSRSATWFQPGPRQPDSVGNPAGIIRVVCGVRRSVLWAIDLEATDPEAANRLGEEITGGNEAGAGLLANRHAQNVAWEVVTN